MNQQAPDIDGLLDEHGPKLVPLARQWAGNRADAEDVFHEAFVRYWPNRERARDPIAYLYRSVRHTAMNFRPGRARSTHRDVRAAGDDRTLVPVAATTEAEERASDIAEALKALPIRSRPSTTSLQTKQPKGDKQYATSSLQPHDCGEYLVNRHLAVDRKAERKPHRLSIQDAIDRMVHVLFQPKRDIRPNDKARKQPQVSPVAREHIAGLQHRMQLRSVGHVVRVMAVVNQVHDQTARRIEQPRHARETGE